ncbi:hypothetical protein K466DRAFT_246 [Polyporus arcularius HHB13444]|uniref:Uncharacterized protein n=1 Tax=Polyporus arcularius HHB13444 TaxID=1314778 RepID=A0A5C3Q921_9APHY|nr:hypothetical protein K466DRAFT_246 [Polyporus arcularius HHB13444]
MKCGGAASDVTVLRSTKVGIVRERVIAFARGAGGGGASGRGNEAAAPTTTLRPTSDSVPKHFYGTARDARASLSQSTTCGSRAHLQHRRDQRSVRKRAIFAVHQPAASSSRTLVERRGGRTAPRTSRRAHQALQTILSAFGPDIAVLNFIAESATQKAPSKTDAALPGGSSGLQAVRGRQERK